MGLESLRVYRNRLKAVKKHNGTQDRSEEMTRTLRKSARSVGLQLPEVYRA
ncbi:hypothetical protein MKX01_021331 [Papaver californicum]|nr:hypothetical protein MKX01_021331 [Papaver californicum]